MNILIDRNLDISITKAEIRFGGKHATQLRKFRAMVYERDMFTRRKKTLQQRNNRIMDIARFYHRKRYEDFPRNWDKAVRIRKLLSFLHSVEGF